MNTILDILFLRRPRLEYISPPVCQDFVPVSASGSAILVESVASPAPLMLFFADGCHRFLTWKAEKNQYCTGVYTSASPSGPFVDTLSCLMPGNVAVISKGWWTIVSLTAHLEPGEAISESPLDSIEEIEGAPSAPAYADGTSYILLPIPTGGGINGYRLYKNPNFSDKTAQYFPVLDSSRVNLVEVLAGCYAVQPITKNGAGAISNIVCADLVRLNDGCYFSGTCPLKSIFDPLTLSCIVDTLSGITGPLDFDCFNAAYASSCAAVGGTSPFTWSLVSGATPPGIVFHAGTYPGISVPLDGTPTVPGNYSFTVNCVSAVGAQVSAAFQISVLGFSPDFLPAGTTDTPYVQTLVGAGGVAPYVFNLEAGTLPAGITLSPSGSFLGTPRVSDSETITVGITDAQNRKCTSDLQLVVNACPVGVSHPTITVTGENANTVASAGLDRKGRILWIPEDGFQVSAPFRFLHLVDTASLSYLGTASDTGNIVNSLAKGRTNPVVVIDTKYNQAVTGQAQWSWYSLTTKDALAVTTAWGYPDWQQDYTAYDAGRGYIYVEQPSIGGVLRMDVVDCNPSSRVSIASIGPVAGISSSIAYSPGADMVYLANEAGPTLLHKWNPVTQLYTTNTGLNVGAKGVQVFSIRVLDLILINADNGHLYIIDPNNADALVADIIFGGGLALVQPEYNDCTGHVYLCSKTSFSQPQIFDPSAAWAALGAVPGVGTDEGYVQKFDKYGNRLFTHARATGIVHTY